MAEPESLEDAVERYYLAGSRRAYLVILQQCLSALEPGDPEVGRLRWVGERQEAVAALRRLCAEFGDNDWPDGLYLSDVIEKHLGWHLRAQE